MSIAIDIILRKLDFEKIRAYMILTKWTYRNNPISPTIEELKSNAHSLLSEVENMMSKYPDESSFSMGGGFRASYSHRMKQLTLEFIIEKVQI